MEVLAIFLGSNLSQYQNRPSIRPDSDLKSFKLTVDPFVVIASIDSQIFFLCESKR
jgi:hypothetical protein